jgi:hypothetical protein
MPKQHFEEYNQQSRKADKKKKHRKGFNEDAQESRAQRVNFKRYVRTLEEQQLEDYDDEDVDY